MRPRRWAAKSVRRTRMLPLPLPLLVLACRSRCWLLYADIAGGCTDVNMAVCSTPLESVEVLDPITEKWELIASMNNKRGRLGLATVQNKLYAIGGDDGDGNCARMGKMVEVYNAELDAWRLAPPMPTYRCGFGVAALHGLICAPNRPAALSSLCPCS